MRLFYFIAVLLFFLRTTAQEKNESLVLEFVDSISFKADIFIGVDDFENYYSIEGNTFYKKTNRHLYSYTNTQLGSITSVDITNPLKVLLFYRDFNTIVILDNRLNELTDVVNFSRESYNKNVSLTKISSNNNLWLYSLDDNVLSLWNYETRQIIFDSQPLSFYEADFEAIYMISDYENCWLSSNKGILKFNEFGSYLETISSINFTYIRPYGNGFTYLDSYTMFAFENNVTTKIEFVNNNHFSTNYFVNKNNLYFFKDDVIYKYSILKK